MVKFTLSKDSLPFSFFDEVGFSLQNPLIESIKEKYPGLSQKECGLVLDKNEDVINDVLSEMFEFIGYEIGEYELDESTGTWVYIDFEIPDLDRVNSELDSELKSLMREYLNETKLNIDFVLG